MKPSRNETNTKQTQLVNTVVNTLLVKKELKSKMENGEDIRKAAKEKGLKIVLPL